MPRQDAHSRPPPDTLDLLDQGPLASPFVKTVLATLTGLFQVSPDLVLAVLLLFMLNTLAGLWLGFVDPGEHVLSVARNTLTRFGVYALALVGAVVASRLTDVLAWLNTFMFASLGAWEFLVMLSILARIYPPFRPLYLRVNLFVQERADLAVPDPESPAPGAPAPTAPAPGAPPLPSSPDAPHDDVA